ncbi:MAG: hypothetical protein FIA91_02540 [Geobacter sp.]|nr:hypothetical protein [Geobacter sp.]
MENQQGHSATVSSVNDQLAKATENIAEKNYAAALAVLQQIPVAARSPLALSAYALCLATVENSYKIAVNTCHDAIRKDPKNPEHYFRQGRILLLAGRKKDAIWVMRMGLRQGRHKGIIDTLAAFGIRRSPPLNFLPRSNLINKYLGLMMSRLNLR